MWVRVLQEFCEARREEPGGRLEWFGRRKNWRVCKGREIYILKGEDRERQRDRQTEKGATKEVRGERERQSTNIILQGPRSVSPSRAGPRPPRHPSLRSPPAVALRRPNRQMHSITALVHTATVHAGIYPSFWLITPSPGPHRRDPAGHGARRNNRWARR